MDFTKVKAKITSTPPTPTAPPGMTAEAKEANKWDKRGQKCEEEGNLAQAIRAWEKAGEIYPFNPDLWLDLAFAYAKTCQLEQAKQACTIARMFALPPEKLEFVLYLYLNELKDLDGARDVANRLLELNPKHRLAQKVINDPAIIGALSSAHNEGAVTNGDQVSIVFRYRVVFNFKERRYRKLPPKNPLETFLFKYEDADERDQYEFDFGKEHFFLGFVCIFAQKDPRLCFIPSGETRELTFYQGGKVFSFPSVESITTDLSGKFGVIFQDPKSRMPKGEKMQKSQEIRFKGLQNADHWFGMSVDSINKLMPAHNVELDMSFENTPENRLLERVRTIDAAKHLSRFQLDDFFRDNRKDFGLKGTAFRVEFFITTKERPLKDITAEFPAARDRQCGCAWWNKWFSSIRRGVIGIMCPPRAD